MAKQGMVTVKSGGKVVMKVLAGCDGDNAEKLADRLREAWPVNADQAYELAQQAEFGSTEDLVVITETEGRFDGDEDFPDSYWDTFAQPGFNPRSKEGISEKVTIINV